MSFTRPMICNHLRDIRLSRRLSMIASEAFQAAWQKPGAFHAAASEIQLRS